MTVFVTPVTRRFLALCAIVLVIHVVVGLLGFTLHTRVNLHGPSPDWFDNFIFGAPALAPMLFPNLALLCGIGLWGLRAFVHGSESTVTASTEPTPS